MKNCNADTGILEKLKMKNWNINT